MKDGVAVNLKEIRYVLISGTHKAKLVDLQSVLRFVFAVVSIP
ncbi:hypothetical protein JCM19240_1553 [Vibrio maritimus]|uniref:Uncharacterized protein n=1 Tax=Vibrio maritimus TaxID=990268 RepID=A0A090T859_9VIBR|nr:hypothetical protein JCM19240_1553 [Vibrio maritimus]